MRNVAIQYTSEEKKKYVLLKGNILKRMEAERVSDAQMAAATGMAVRTYRREEIVSREIYLSRNSEDLFNSVEVSGE